MTKKKSVPAPPENPWTNRVIGHGVERVDQLVANPRNWRLHPKYQSDALLAIIREVGFVRSLLVNKRTGFLVDGHDRVYLALEEGQTELPVEYVDLSDEEEAYVLMTLDPISALAQTDALKVQELADLVHSQNDQVNAMIANILEATKALAAQDGERGKTPTDKINGYLNATIKQIVLYFSGEEYDKVVERLAKVRDHYQVESNTEAVLKLLEFYEGTTR